jgi:tetratricopeptide (TPR) repeat protein
MLWNTIKAVVRGKGKELEEPLDRRIRAFIRERRLDEALDTLQRQASKHEVEAERLALLGEVYYHRKDPTQAEGCFTEALRQRPNLAEGHYGLSLLYYDSGRIDDALTHAQYARNIKPDSAPVLAQLGLCYIARRNYQQALDVLRQATLLDPDDIAAVNNLGIALHATGRTQEALYYFKRALSLNPRYAPAIENIRTLYGIQPFGMEFDPISGTPQPKMDHFPAPAAAGADEEEANVIELEQGFAADPKDADVVQRLVSAYLKTLRLEEARDVLHIALAHNPDSVPLLTLTARIAHMLGQKKRACDTYERALELDPQNLDALLGMSQVLRDLGRVNDALEYTERAAALDDGPNTLVQLVAAQANACKYAECLQTCARIEAEAPHLAPFLMTSRAVSHAYLGEFDRAYEYLDHIKRMDPDNFGLRVFIGLIDLMHERYEQGWQGYRYRHLMESDEQRVLPFPVWQGESLQGKTILVLAEQGLGDQVMFASCLPDLLAKQPAKVLLEANARVAKTLERSFPAVQTIHSGQRKDFEWYNAGLAPDYYVHIADLPRHFRNHREDFPQHHGYLRADAERTAYWRERLSSAGARPRIGFSWRGGLQKTRQSVRSLDLPELLPLLRRPDVQWVNLQYGDVAAEIEALARRNDLSLLNFPEAIQDLDEFAALISSLDLVVTVCNTTVHYAGALGKPCWVMAPYIPEWRYGLKGSTMRWYPSVTMFRQHAPGDWSGVLARVHEALEGFLAGSHEPLPGMILAAS